MTRDSDKWTISHFSQSNGKVLAANDVAGLMRSVAKSIEELGDVTVQDITFHSELNYNSEEYDHTFTVYYYRDADHS